MQWRVKWDQRITLEASINHVLRDRCIAAHPNIYHSYIFCIEYFIFYILIKIIFFLFFSYNIDELIIGLSWFAVFESSCIIQISLRISIILFYICSNFLSFFLILHPLNIYFKHILQYTIHFAIHLIYLIMYDSF